MVMVLQMQEGNVEERRGRLNLARDCHEQNSLLSRGETPGQVRLTLTRPLTSDQDLLAWFNDDLAADLHIPFLSLQNIKGTFVSSKYG